MSVALHVALYVDQHDTSTRQLEMSWDQLAGMLLAHEESPCTVEDGPDKCAGKGDKRHPRGCPHKSRSKEPDEPMAWVPAEIEGSRLDANVRSLSCLVLDYDHVPLEDGVRVEEALAPYEHVTHTTHSYCDDDPCFRVILPLSRPVPADQWSRFLPAAIDFLGAKVSITNAKGKVEEQPDRTCKNRSRLYYFPSHPRGAPHGAEPVEGKILDVDEVLAWAAARPVAGPAPAQTEAPAPSDPPPFREAEWFHSAPLPEGADWDIASAPVQKAIKLLAENFPDRRRHELCLALGGVLRRLGASQDDARDFVYEAAKAGGSTDPDGRASTVAHTYALTDDSEMTGFSRVAEILGRPLAERLGDLLVDARNAAFLRRLYGERGAPERPPAAPQVPPGAPGSAQDATGAPGAGAAVPADLAALRQSIAALAARKARALGRDDRVAAVLLRRVLSGELLARPAGVGDPETVREEAERGVGRAAAVRSVAATLGYVFPPGTPWEAAAEILRPSVYAMEADVGWDWLVPAAEVYRRAQESRVVQEAVRSAEAAALHERVRAEIAGDLPDEAADAEDPEDPEDPEVLESAIKRKADGSPEPIPWNARVILEHHPDFRGTIRWNEVAKAVEVRGGVLEAQSKYGIEAVVCAVQDWLASSKYAIKVPYHDLARRVMAVARRNSFDPIKDYLRSVKWDGVPRITSWLVRYCGAEDNDYIRSVGRKWLIALVARGLQPGCKVDNVLVFEGLTGLGKSSAFEILGGDWFCDTAVDLADKDARLMAGKYLICEMAEIISFKRSGHDTLKSFFSSRVDRFRPPYAAAMEESPRRCVFVGTTNDDQYLGDETGNRRYWPVACVYSPDALDALKRDRDQLFAEAVVAFQAGEPWWFKFEDIAVTEAEAEKRMLETPARTKVSDWWYSLASKDRPHDLTTMEVAEAALGAIPAQTQSGLLIQIGHALKKMGFVRQREGAGKRDWRYFATAELLSAPKITRNVPKKPALSLLPGGLNTAKKKD